MAQIDYTLIVDTREKENTLKALNDYNIKYTIDTLQTGDLKIITPEGSVTVERKQMTDFIGSLLSGRLEEQMRRLSKETCPGLLITGSFAEYRQHAKTTKFTMDHVIGAVASCVVKYGLRFVIWIQSVDTQPHATGVALTAKIIKKIAEGKLDNIPDRKLRNYEENPQREIVRILFGVPSNVAQELLNNFKCIRRIMAATDDDLIKIKGMGHTRIAKMRKILEDEMCDGKREDEIRKG